MSKFVLLIVSLFLCFNLFSQETRTIHVFVALCDNKNQGIVPVSKLVGNGQDTKNNLYWGAGYGVKTYFSASAEWQLISKTIKPGGHILERLLYKHKSSKTYMLADAYDGAYIKETTIDFLKASYGASDLRISADSMTLHFGGGSDLIAYIGHDGLMDFQLSFDVLPKTNKKRDLIILACASKQYFRGFINKSGAYPLLWTTNLMCPEAYTLKSALDGWISNESVDQVRERAAKTYSQFQKCSLIGSKKLLITGW